MFKASKSKRNENKGIKIVISSFPLIWPMYSKLLVVQDSKNKKDPKKGKRKQETYFILYIQIQLEKIP